MSINPWTSVWFHPRETVHMVILNPPRHSWVLLFCFGFTSILNGIQSFPMLIRWGTIPILIFAVILAPFWGYAFFGIWSWIVQKIGKWLKGQADFNAVRMAYTWSRVPLIGSAALWVLLAFFYANFIFFGSGPYSASLGVASFLFIVLIGKLVLEIWSLVIFLQMLAEVQQFSILRAIINVVLSALTLGVLTAAIIAVSTMISMAYFKN
jgi:hypothetical protein